MKIKSEGDNSERKKNHLVPTAVITGMVAIALLGFMILQGGETEPAMAEVDNTEEIIAEKLAASDKLRRGYYYEEALALLQADPTLITETTDDAIKLKMAEIEKEKASLIKYEGPIHHVFFHSLIVYPELAFDNKGHSAEGYNMWMTTVSEFKKMLPILMGKGYVLYPLAEYIENDPVEADKVILKDIYLPPGKIPLVISIDDVNYYDYMKPDGFANRLVVGEDNRVWTEVITPEGDITVTRDGDVMPILDDFVEENPEFSWRGTKGVMAVTGYQGALGYRITDNLPQEEEWKEQVKEIADIMKADGWLFACHSYTHNGYFRTGAITLKQMKYDADRWNEKIAPYVGKTNIYISPFGVKFKDQDPRYRYLVEQGFNIYCPVGNDKRIYENRDNIVMPRINLDGYTMNKRPEEVKRYYFDVAEVIDPARPAL